jgi:hypothetical protein
VRSPVSFYRAPLKHRVREALGMSDGLLTAREAASLLSVPHK